MHVRYSPNSLWLAISYENGLVEVRDTTQYEVWRTFRVQRQYIPGIAWSGDSKHLAAGDANGWVSVWSCD
jgi:WD40 repeat protein